jgi:Tfp pilus assembly protein PilX
MMQARPHNPKQHGVVLLIALIMLITITLGGLALYRQVGTGIIVASNLAFKNSALIAADRGLEAARAWLVSTALDLGSASVPNGYFAAWCNSVIDPSNNPDANNDGQIDDCKANPSPGNFDPRTFNWDNSALATADDGNGNQVRYVVHRLCRIPGALNYTHPLGIPQECVTLGSSTATGGAEIIDYGNRTLTSKIQPYFRVTAQTTGPRNTTVYTQMILY